MSPKQLAEIRQGKRRPAFDPVSGRWWLKKVKTSENVRCAYMGPKGGVCKNRRLIGQEFCARHGGVRSDPRPKLDPQTAKRIIAEIEASVQAALSNPAPRQTR